MTSTTFVYIIIRIIRKSKTLYLFNENQITKIHNPPTIFDGLLEIEEENKIIKSIKQVNEPSDKYIHIKYEFTKDGNKYNCKQMDIELHDNTKIIYKENLSHFTKLYQASQFSKSMDISKFIQISINDALKLLSSNK